MARTGKCSREENRSRCAKESATRRAVKAHGARRHSRTPEMNMAVEWTIRFPYIFAYCSDCKSTFEIEKPTPTVHIRHCGNQRQRLPEKIYESFCDIRDGKQ